MTEAFRELMVSEDLIALRAELTAAVGDGPPPQMWADVAQHREVLRNLCSFVVFRGQRLAPKVLSLLP